MVADVVGDVSERISSTFEWRIPKFWAMTDHFRSPTFQFWDATWKLEILYGLEMVFYVIRDACEQESQVVSFKLSARKSDETEYTILEGKFEFTEDKNEVVSSLTEEELLNHKLTPDGSLTIFCVLCGNRSIAKAESISSEPFQLRPCHDQEYDEPLYCAPTLARSLTSETESNTGTANAGRLRTGRSKPRRSRRRHRPTPSRTPKLACLLDGQKCIEENDGSMKDSTIDDDVSQKCPKLTGVDKLLKDLKNLLVTEEDSDVCFKVKDRQFKAHKNILRVRSSVFYSMFKHDMAEKNSGIVEIVDCDPEAFQNFLRYLYTGYVEDLSNDIVVQLYRVADKYDAEEVKTKCFEFMTNSLSVETFCDVAALALEYNEAALLETATEFFCKNIREIIVTVQWQYFLKENTVAANELHVKALDYYVIRK